MISEFFDSLLTDINIRILPQSSHWHRYQNSSPFFKLTAISEFFRSPPLTEIDIGILPQPFHWHWYQNFSAVFRLTVISEFFCSLLTDIDIRILPQSSCQQLYQNSSPVFSWYQNSPSVFSLTFKQNSSPIFLLTLISEFFPSLLADSDIKIIPCQFKKNCEMCYLYLL